MKAGDIVLSCIILIGSILCYLPIILEYDLQSHYLFDYQQPLYVHSTIASVAVAFPLSIDVIFNRDLPWRMILSRWILLSSVIVPNLLIFLSLECQTTIRAHSIIICSSRVRQILCNGGLLTIYDRTVPYQRKFRIGILLLGVISNICQTFIPFIGLTSFLQITQGLCGFGLIIGIFYSCSLYFYFTMYQKEHLSFLEKYCLLQSLMLIVNLGSKVVYVGMNVTKNTELYSIQVTTFFLFCDTFTAVIAFVAPTRMAIEEASIARVSFLCCVWLWIVVVGCCVVDHLSLITDD